MSAPASDAALTAAHAVIRDKVLALEVTTYFGDDDQARAFRLHQAERLLTNDADAMAAVRIVRTEAIG